MAQADSPQSHVTFADGEWFKRSIPGTRTGESRPDIWSAELEKDLDVTIVAAHMYRSLCLLLSLPTNRDLP